MLNVGEFAAFGEYWRCRLDSYACERAEFTPPGNPLEVPSPDKKVAVSQRGHDLWARSLSDGHEWALTTDGELDYQYGSGPDSTSNGTLLRKFGLPYLPPAVTWSPDSTKVLAHRTDERGVRQTHLVEARPADGGAPVLRTQRYAYPGDENMPQAQLVVLDVAEGTVVRAQAEPLLMPQFSPIMATWAWWDEAGSAVYYLSQRRDLRTLSLHRLAPATAVRLVVANLLTGRSPLYALSEWAAGFAPARLGLATGRLAALNDDRVGRALEQLFDADRASLLTELILGVVNEFGVDTAQPRNDSTSVSVHGAYREATGAARGGKPTPPAAP